MGNITISRHLLGYRLTIQDRTFHVEGDPQVQLCKPASQHGDTHWVWVKGYKPHRPVLSESAKTFTDCPQGSPGQQSHGAMGEHTFLLSHSGRFPQEFMGAREITQETSS